LHHAAHTERGRAGADGLFHDCKPAMWQTIRAALEIRGDDLIFQDSVKREAIGLVLCFLIVIFALLADCPAILAVITLVPPAIQNAAIGQAVERSLLATGSA